VSLAAGVDRVEYHFEVVGDDDADHCRLWCTRSRLGCLHGQRVAAKERQEISPGHGGHVRIVALGLFFGNLIGVRLL
jgi:hypothetical protein